MTQQKKFNITGPCIPSLHYMVDIRPKTNAIINDYIKKNEYFTINRARQYGKTTTLELLYQQLREQYIVVDISFEGKEDYFSSLESFALGFSLDIAERLAGQPILATIFEAPFPPHLPLRDLANRITQLCARSEKEVILFIDEVDKASDNNIFVAFLGMLRDKFIERQRGKDNTFKSVILAGVHDIKNLKTKLRPDEKHSYNSPWNIAVPFHVDMSFSAAEIATMLHEYEKDFHTGMDVPAVSERLFYYSNGYPFLVSVLCLTLHEACLSWDCKGVDEAEKCVVKGNNTLFDDIIKNLSTHPGFCTLVERILLRGAQVPFEIRNPEIDLGVMYGIFIEDGHKIKIANVVFETVIFNYFISIANTGELIDRYTEERNLFVKNGILNMSSVLERFAAFMRSEYRNEDGVFIEQHVRLLFLSFLKPIINGVGHYAVEPETRGSRRMDIAIFYGSAEHIVELKIWRGEQAALAGYDQLTNYLESRGQKKGYLLSFCDNKKMPREGKVFEHRGFLITEVVVAYRDNV